MVAICIRVNIEMPGGAGLPFLVVHQPRRKPTCLAGLPVCRSAGLPVCRSAGLPGEQYEAVFLNVVLDLHKREIPMPTYQKNTNRASKKPLLTEGCGHLELAAASDAA